MNKHHTIPYQSEAVYKIQSQRFKKKMDDSPQDEIVAVINKIKQRQETRLHIYMQCGIVVGGISKRNVFFQHV